MAHRQHPRHTAVHLLNGGMFLVGFATDEKKLIFAMQFNSAVYVKPIDQATALSRLICRANETILKKNSVCIRLTQFRPSNYFGVIDQNNAFTRTESDDTLRNAQGTRTGGQKQWRCLAYELNDPFYLLKLLVRKITALFTQHNTIKQGKLSDAKSMAKQ